MAITYSLFIALVTILSLKDPILGLNSRDGSSNMTGVRCLERERRALIEFKQGFVDKSGWLSSWGIEDGKRECCSWEGVKCSKKTGHVLMLDLQGSYLQNRILEGKIGPSLAALKKLRYLDLSEHEFISGPIPNQLGNLSLLQYLNLGGTLAELESLNSLSSLSNLEYLDLSNVNLSLANDWLKVVNQLKKLQFLSIQWSRLALPSVSSIGNSFNRSTSLTTINLRGNYLTGVFQWLFNISTSLEVLDLAFNELNGTIPYAFADMNALTYLDLSYNKLEGEVPKSFGNLCALQTLNLSANNLNGQINFIGDISSCATQSFTKSLRLSQNYSSFSPFLSLKEIDLSENKFNGSFVESIRNLSDLQMLDVSNNYFQEEISEAQLSNFPKLKLLLLGLNSLTLNFSLNWVPPFQLDIIDLRSCKLGPHFPSWLRTQKSIFYLDISSNDILDSVPSWFPDLTSGMAYLNLSNNQIHGNFPNLSAHSEVFPIIDLSSNSFEGPLPHFPTNTSSLYLTDNTFRGSILPLCKINSSNFWLLDLSSNLLSNALFDECLSSWPMLRVLNLGYNNLSGKISSSMGSMRLLQVLDLYGNSFSGELPFTERNFLLRFVNLGGNNFSGNLQSWIGKSLSSLQVLILRSNKFKGSIPVSLCQLVCLQILDISLNSVSGTIPWCFSNFTAMMQQGDLQVSVSHYDGSINVNSYLLDTFIEYYIYKALVVFRGREDKYARNLMLLRVIDLSSNKLTGHLPDEITSLAALVSLNLSRNSLSGEIPWNIGHLKQLQSLDLSRNKFSGRIPTGMSNLTFLSHLDLSYNKLSGEIPSSTQLQSFNASVYMENEGLYGPPLTQIRQTEDIKQPDDGSSAEEDDFMEWFYIGMGTGFFVGFWGICSGIFFNRGVRRILFSSNFCRCQ